MQMKNVIEIVPLCHRSAPCCLGLAERTFVKDFTKYKAINYRRNNYFNKFCCEIARFRRQTL
jgi:hypothetical protein